MIAMDLRMPTAALAALMVGTSFARQVRVEAPEVAKTVEEHVKADFPTMPASGICRYSVPAMGDTQYLPDAYPFDGIAGAPCVIVAAKDEYEPGAFLLYATRDYGKIDFTIGALKNEKGDVFPSADLDLVTVKVWYQNGNGWYSYFQDVGKKLCPELLLHDEDLVKVDTRTQDNYARLTEKDGKVSYFWITAPRKVYNRFPGFESYWTPQAFMAMKENFCDAPVFKGATLRKGEFKEFILTAHVQKNAKAGLYRGSIVLSKDGRRIDEVPVSLRVHDFVLPRPKTYFDTKRDFRTYFCEYNGIDRITYLNGGDAKLAKRQLLAICKDFVRHGYVIPGFNEWTELTDLCKEAGMEFEGAGGVGMRPGDPADVRVEVRKSVARCDRDFGFHKGFVASWGDEYGLSTLRQIRYMIEMYQEAGFLLSVNSRYGYSAGANVADLWWPPYAPDQRRAREAGKFNQLGGEKWMGWYSDHHCGPESPAFNRRQYGFGPYRAGFSCNYNYAHHLDGWNDIEPTLYKPMMLIYGAGHGCIDTLAWEGFREGLDDIRYATLLKTLAEPLSGSDNVKARYAARLALKLLADADGDNDDLQTLRLEMIEWIEKLRKFR